MLPGSRQDVRRQSCEQVSESVVKDLFDAIKLLLCNSLRRRIGCESIPRSDLARRLVRKWRSSTAIVRSREVWMNNECRLRTAAEAELVPTDWNAIGARIVEVAEQACATHLRLSGGRLTELDIEDLLVQASKGE